MLKNSLIYFVLFNLLQFLLVEINCIKPSQRSLHTTTFIDNKLYVLGGRFSADNTVTSLGRGFFYLDFSVPFTTQSPSWEDISSKNFIPQHTGAAAVIGGKKNDTLFLYGGETTYERMAAVYTYTPSSNAWGIPNVDGSDGNDVNVNGINLYRKALLTGIGDNGNMYLWGGQLGKGSFVNDMLILDTRNLKWIIGSLVNSPTPRSNYGATLLPNNKIIYMGGSNGLNIGLDEVYIYDTVNDSWDTKKTSGKIPSNRQGFSANLGLDGNRVIIFGGLGIDSTDALYVLSLDDFKWNIPKISGNLPGSRHQRYEHKSDVIKNYMVITFGRGYNPNESDILLLDISNNANYVWTTNFDPSGSSTVPKKSQNYKLIGIVAASVISTMLLTVGSFYLYKWNKNRKNRKAISPTSVVLDKSVVLTMVNDNNDNSQESKQIKK